MPGPSERKFRLGDALNQMIAQISDLTARDQFDKLMLERTFHIREHLALPICRFLQRRKRAVKSADSVMALLRAAEEYVVCLPKEPEKCGARRKNIEALAHRVRRELLRTDDREGKVEKLLDEIRQWQWKAVLDAHGRIAFTTGEGVTIPARSDILHKVGPRVIEQAVKAQRPYADDVRPRDLRGEPGGLVVLRGAKRLLVVGDLHGRYDNLEHILRDKDNLKGIIDGGTHLVFTGDAIHPWTSGEVSEEVYEESFCVMLLIMTLKAENPFHVHYLLGNHDNAHVGGRPVIRHGARQAEALESYFMSALLPSVVKRYRQFVVNCPVAIRAHGAAGAILFVHSTLTARLRDEESVINIFVEGRAGTALEDLLWSREFDAERIGQVAKRLGARLVVGGHTIISPQNAKALGFDILAPLAFARIGKVQLLVNSQSDQFGYLDIDLTRPVPDDVGELVGPEGQNARRLVVSKAPAGSDA